MVPCDQGRCRHCMKDTVNNVLVCSITPVLIRVEGMREFMLKCNSYKYRLPGEHLMPLLPVEPDGLYPGQIKPQPDYSDFDPEPTLALDLEAECDT